MSEIDHGRCTCPHCGYVHRNSWELPGSDGEVNTTTCGKCEADFEYYRNVEVTFVSMKIPTTDAPKNAQADA